MKLTARDWIRTLNLKSHPEGGWFRRIHTSEHMTDTGRPVMSSIYYLLEGTDFSALHRLKQEEQWNFHAGAPLTLHEIDDAGRYRKVILGEDRFQHVVLPGTLFGATVDGTYALIGCTVVPAFDEQDFEMPSRADLLGIYPQHAALIRRLTR